MKNTRKIESVVKIRQDECPFCGRHENTIFNLYNYNWYCNDCGEHWEDETFQHELEELE